MVTSKRLHETHSSRLKRPASPVEEEKKRGRKRKDDTVYEEFLQSNKKALIDQINYKDLGAFDDLLTDCFIDKVSLSFSEVLFLPTSSFFFCFFLLFLFFFHIAYPC